MNNNIPTLNQDEEQHVYIHRLKNMMKNHQCITNPARNIKETESTASHSINTIDTTIMLPYHFTLYNNPTNNTFYINILIQGIHHILRIILDMDMNMNMNLIKLNVCANRTPIIHIPKWRSTLRNGYLSHINETPTTDIHQLNITITKARQNQDTSVCIYDLEPYINTQCIPF